MPLTGESTQQGPNFLWKAAASATAVLSLGVAACGGAEDPNQNQETELAPAAVPDEGESAAAESQTTTSTPEQLDPLAEHSPLDDLQPYRDQLLDQDPSLVADTFFARVNRFFDTGNPEDLRRFGSTARDNAVSIDEHEAPISMTPSEDAVWGWRYSTHDESFVVFLERGSIAVDHGDPEQSYTIGEEGFLLVARWIPDGDDSYFGRFDFSVDESLLEEDPGIVFVDEAPPEAFAEIGEVAETTTTTEPAPTTEQTAETPSGAPATANPGDVWIDPATGGSYVYIENIGWEYVATGE